MLKECLQFRLPRDGYRADEYEDASAAASDAGRFAMSDGATNSSFSGLWARILVEDFIENPDYDLVHTDAFLTAAQVRWRTSPIVQEVRDRIAREPLRSWSVEAKLAEGAFATFLGLTLVPSADDVTQWTATAVGDTCLFHTRGSTMLETFPIDRSVKFGNVPPLLGSCMSLEQVGQTPRQQATGVARAGDCLWMMTDALARWCLRQQEDGSEPWSEIETVVRAFDGEKRFTDWIADLRRHRRLHNDDVTLMLIVL